MTLGELKTLAGQFIALDLDSFSSTTGAVSTDQVNYAVRHIARWLKPISFLTFNYQAGVSSYSTQSSAAFSATPVRILSVVVSGNQLMNYARVPGLYSLDELQLIYPSWTNPGTGAVVAAAQLGTRLILVKAPAISGTATVIAEFLPNALTSDSQTPDLPVEIHECIAYLAASYAAKPTMTEQEGINRVMTYDTTWQQMMGELKTTYDNLAFASGYQRMLGSDQLTAPINDAGSE